MPIISEIFSLADDPERFRRVLGILAGHLSEPVVVTGSFATEWHFLRPGGDAGGRRLKDIDIVLTDGTASVGEDIAEDFLINHFHPGRERGNVYMQLVEAERRHG